MYFKTFELTNIEAHLHTFAELISSFDYQELQIQINSAKVYFFPFETEKREKSKQKKYTINYTAYSFDIRF